jgi:hypothetical protein
VESVLKLKHSRCDAQNIYRQWLETATADISLRRDIELAKIDHVKTRIQGGKEIQYLEWRTVVKYLDHFAPGWSFEVRNVITTPERCVVVARISIPCLEGIIHREATGTEDEELRGYGDPSSIADAMALKRTASECGLALYLYSKGVAIG